MSINLKCLFKKFTGTVQFEDGRTDDNKDFMSKELAKIVKVGIVFGTIACLLFLALSIIYFKVPEIEGQEEDNGGHIMDKAMSVNLNCFFNKRTNNVRFQEDIPLLYDKEFVHKQLTNIVKTGIFFGIITSLLLLALILTVFNVANIEGPGCRFYPFEVDPSPIIIISGSDDFIYPKHDVNNNLRFVTGQSLDIICPGRSVIWEHSRTNDSVISGSCVEGSTIKIANEEVDWRHIRCSDSPMSTVRITGASCYNNSKELEVGFEISKNRFLRSMLICFNQELQIAHYSYVKLPASINRRILHTKRPQFQQGTDIYDIGKVDNLYKRKNQRATINRLLGLSDDSTQYIQNNNNYFLSRGHLTANMDNFYAAQQNATFYYQNVAPQWQTFNGLNWNQIEIDVRDYAEANAVDLQVWTGVYGVATLPHTDTKRLLNYFYLLTAQRTGKPFQYQKCTGKLSIIQ